MFPDLSVDLGGVSVSCGILDTKVYLFNPNGHLFTISYLAKCEALLMSGRACPIVRDDLKGIALEKDDLVDVMVEWYLLEFVDFEDVEMDVCESDLERIYENMALFDENNAQWEFEYDDGYVPTRKAA